MVPTEDVNGKNMDIKDADGMDRGQGGMPPGARLSELIIMEEFLKGQL